MTLLKTLTDKIPFVSSLVNCNFTAIIKTHGKEGNSTAGCRNQICG